MLWKKLEYVFDACVCPQCAKFWHDTKCPRCKMWSPHDDWYHADSTSRLISLKELEGKIQN